MDFILTIEEDDVVAVEEDDDLDTDTGRKSSTDLFSSEFLFPEDGVEAFGDNVTEALASLRKTSYSQSTLESKIARAREARREKKERIRAEEKYAQKQIESITSENEEDMKSSESSDEDYKEDIVSETTEKEKFFSKPPPLVDGIAFTDMNISRPLLKAVAGLGFSTPTPVQVQCIPLALMGRDICACAATGTGKTAAFMLPILERLLFRPSRVRVTRVLVLLPTRELAIQVHSVGKALAQHTDVELCLATGGLHSKTQEAALRKNPDIVVATPGRLVDHLHNTPSFSLQTVEVVVLDEADRMLDEHFMEQMNEIIRLCPRGRQTLLFSATMTDEVEELARLSLHQPVRVFVDSNTDTADNLQQEFVRIRPAREADREAIVVALCCRTFKEHCLVFLPTRKEAHRMRILFGFLGLQAGELHGDLSQLQRLEALKQFQDGQVDFLLATDLAARGLDIERIKIVINMNMPQTMKQYIHRVGRTARAGRSGRSVTLVGERGRKVLREVMKQSRSGCPVKSRQIPPEVVNKYRDKIRSLEGELKAILKQEEEEKLIRVSEMELNKAQNLLDHKQEIMSRPPRVWFQEKSKDKKRLATGEGRAAKQSRTEDQNYKGMMKKEMDFAKRITKRAKMQLDNPSSVKHSGKRKGSMKLKPVISAYDGGVQSKLKTAKQHKMLFKGRHKGHVFKSKKRYKRR